MTWVAGVDGCHAGWVVVLVEIRQPRPHQIRVCANFAEVLNIDPKPTVIALDIPIGLLETFYPGGRDCDREARRALGRRGSSVFSPPVRELLDATSYEEVRSRGMSRQAFGILPKIREVDSMMTPELQNIVCEAHPELAFCSLGHGHPMRFNKKTVAGREERLRALQKVPHGLFRGIGQSVVNVRKAFKRREVGPDDLLDAYVLAWTALRIAEKKAQRFPLNPPVDGKGLRMEIWY